MSDSEDDYMSDKLLNACTKEDVRPGLLHNTTAKREHEMYKKRIAHTANRPKSNREIEEELREKGLNTAISSDNKGFQLLAKMGFKPGEGLGKTNSGLKEPIPIKLKQGSAGVGKPTTKEIISKKRKNQESNLNEKVSRFKDTTREKLQNRSLYKEFEKLQKVCEELDFKNDIEDPIENFFWTRESIKKKLEITEEDDEEFDEFFSSYTTNENLCKVIDYIRTRHLYCFYCAFVANDEEDLETNCPGPYKEDHSDILDM